MTASISSQNQYPNRNNYGLRPISSVQSKPRLEIISSQGQLQVYSSPYRGSFPVVLSEALRSAGLGSQVLIAQFLKGGVSQGSNHSIKLCGKLEWIRPDIYGCIHEEYDFTKCQLEKFEQNKQSIENIWRFCQERIANNTLNKIVLDEIGLAIELGFIQENELISTLENRHDSIDVILTGPSIPTKVFLMADQVTQLRSSK